MNDFHKIITVGICPCWDVTCCGAGLDWDSHKVLDSQDIAVAGKAFNISRALAQMGSKSTAAGLWGKNDYQQMAEKTDCLKDFIDIRFTPAEGSTRLNVTVIDTQNKREMHLRAESKLADQQSMQKLSRDLLGMVEQESICVFAGSIPVGQVLDETTAMIERCKEKRAKIAVDTSGKALERIVAGGGIWVIKPNVAELAELLGSEIEDETTAIVTAARQVCDKAEIVIVSRGRNGAVAVTREGAWQGKANWAGGVINTVGCGDYLLAGFLDGFLGGREKGDIGFGLEKGIKAATVRAMGKDANINSEIKVDISAVKMYFNE